MQSRKIKEALLAERPGAKVSLADIDTVLEAQRSGDWSRVYLTRLYLKRGGDFCKLLEILEK